MNKNPYEGVIEFLKLVREKGGQEVLDLGCGDGRHLVYLVREGFSASGMDYSLWGTLRTKQWLESEKLQAELVCAEAACLPWPAERFDAVMSVQVIHHQRIDALRLSFDEVERVLRPGGFFYAVIPHFPPDDWKDGKYIEIEAHTFMPTEGFEQGIPHHFFTEDELADELSRFKVMEAKVDPRGKLFVLAQKAVV